jgi:hypothetical protein
MAKKAKKAAYSPSDAVRSMLRRDAHTYDSPLEVDFDLSLARGALRKSGPGNEILADQLVEKIRQLELEKIRLRERQQPKPSVHHATKKSTAQLDREIAAFLQSRTKAPAMTHAIPDRGYMVAQHGGAYLTSFGSKDEAVRFARGLAAQTRESYDIVKVQNRGEDRSIVDEIAPPAARPLGQVSSVPSRS